MTTAEVMDKPKIELKNIKFVQSMSEETPCYSADIWVDGKKFAFVKNSGTGGCDMVSPYKGYNYDDVCNLEKLVKETYPSRVIKEVVGSLPASLESVCVDLLYLYLGTKEAKRILKKIAMLSPNNQVHTWPSKYKVTDTNIDVLLKQNPEYKNLNRMPEAEAIALIISSLNDQ